MQCFDDSSETLQVGSSDNGIINVWKYNSINTKPNTIISKDKLIEKCKLSNVLSTSEDTEYYVDFRQYDTLEGRNAVLDLVNFIDKGNVLSPRKLGESYSCTARSAFRHHEPKTKTHKIRSKDNAFVKQRFGSNNTVSKRRSSLLKTILNTGTQSTSSQKTYNFKNSVPNRPRKKIHILIESKQQQTNYCLKPKDAFAEDVQRQFGIVPKWENPRIENSLKKRNTSMKPPQENRRIEERNIFDFSRLGSKSKESNTDVNVISSDLLSNLFFTDGDDKILSTKLNHNMYQKSYNQYKTYVNPKNNLFMESTSSFSEKERLVNPRLADQLPSRYKMKDQINSCEIKWDFSLMSKHNTSLLDTDLSISTWTSNETYLPNITNTKYQMQRCKISKKYLLRHISTNIKNKNLKIHSKFKTTNANKRAFVKYNPNESSESNSLIVVPMSKIQRLLKNDQVKVICPKGRRIRCKEEDIRSQTNKKQNVADEAKTTTNCKEIIVQNFFVTANNDTPQQITKEIINSGLNGLKIETTSTMASREKRPLIFLNRIAKYFTLFSKKREQLVCSKEKVNTCTDVPSLYNNALETGIYDPKNLKLISSMKYINEKSHINKIQSIYSLHKNKSNENCTNTQNIATRTGSELIAKYTFTNHENCCHKQNGVIHKLKYFLSQIRNKYSDKHVKYSQPVNTTSIYSEAKCSRATNNSTKTPYACYLSKKHDLDKSDEFDYPCQETHKNKQMPVLYNDLYYKPPTSKHITNNIKQRKDHYCRQNNRYEFEKLPSSDVPSYCFNKYNFSENELISKAIRTAIQHQILKTSSSRLLNARGKKKYLNKSGRQCYSSNSFAQRFYAMNVQHLKPYECEPGVCVPDIGRCDPYECIKLINKRRKSGTISRFDKRPIHHRKQGYSPRPPREESVATYNPKKHSVSVGGEGVKYTKLAKKRSKKKHTVRVGSSFSLNVEFSKGKSGGTATPKIQEEYRHRSQMKQKGKSNGAAKPKIQEEHTLEMKKKKKSNGATKPNIQEEHRHRTQMKSKIMDEEYILKTKQTPEKPVKTHKAGQTKYIHKDSSTSTSEQNKHGQLKRCFCTLKLQKKSKSTRRNLDPHECEPNVCIPGRCDPKECLKRIKYRDSGFSAEPVSFSQSTSETSHKKSSARKPTLKNSIECECFKKPKKSGIKSDQKKEQVHGQLSSNIAPNKQAVKIGSTFSFSLEFYKDVAPPVIEVVPDPNRPRQQKITPGRKLRPSDRAPLPSKKTKVRKVGRKSPAASIISDFGVDRGVNPRRPKQMKTNTEVYGLKDRAVESHMEPKGKSRGTATLRRCFCSLKLHKEGLEPAGQVKLVKHSGTTPKKYKKEPDFHSKGAYTGKLLPYECEPGVCVPGQCNTYKCYKRIEARYFKDRSSNTIKPGRIPRSQSTATVYKHAKLGTKRQKRPHLSRGQRFGPDYYDVAQSITTIIEEPRYRPLLKKTRQVVRLGSNFKFNIEFFKDKVEHKDERLPPKLRKFFAGRPSIPVSEVSSRRSYLKRFPTSKKPIVNCKCPEETVISRLKTRPSIPVSNVSSRSSYFQRSQPPIKSFVKCQCPQETGETKSKVAQVKPKKTDKKTNKSISQSKKNASVMTTLRRCFCTLKLKNKEKPQTVYMALLNRYEGPYNLKGKKHKTTKYAVTGQYNEKSNSPTELHKSCKETKTLLKEVLGQQLSFTQQNYCVSKINDIKSISSQLYLEGNQLPRDKWVSSVPRFLNSVYAKIVGNNTFGPKTHKANPKPRKKDRDYIKNKNNVNTCFSTRRTEPFSKYSKESSYHCNVVENSRFKSIKEPLHQAVRVSSSFTLSLVECRRDKLLDDLKPPHKQKHHTKTKQKNNGVKVKSRRKKTEATEENICNGVNLNYCTCSSKKRSREFSRRSLLHKRDSVKIVSKRRSYVEFFKDQNYSVRSNTHSKKARQPRQSASSVRSALKKCALKFQKQIVNYLSINTKSPFKPGNFNVAERYGSKYKSRTESGSKPKMLKNHTHDVNFVSTNTAHKSQSKSNREMETIYPYIPKKFNKAGKNMIHKDPRKHQLRECDSKYQNRKCKRKDNFRDTFSGSQNMLFGIKNKMLVERFLLALKHRIIKNPSHNADKSSNLMEQKRPSTSYKHYKTMSACNKTQHQQENNDSFKVSKSDRRQMKNDNLKKKRQANQNTYSYYQPGNYDEYVKTNTTANNETVANYQYENKTENLELKRNLKLNPYTDNKLVYRVAVNQPWSWPRKKNKVTFDKKEGLKQNQNQHNCRCSLKINQVSFNTKKEGLKQYQKQQRSHQAEQYKIYQVSFDNQKGRKQYLRQQGSHPTEQYKTNQVSFNKKEGQKQYLRQQPQHQCRCSSESTNMTPLFDMHLNAADMSLLNKDKIYDKVVELKRNQNKDYRTKLKMMRQIHGDSCCCCVCKTLRKELNNKTGYHPDPQSTLRKKQNSKTGYLRRHHQDPQPTLRKKQNNKTGYVRQHHQDPQPIRKVNNIKKQDMSMNKSKCSCNSKKCERTYQKELSKKQRLAKYQACVCGTKICKKETLSRISKKNISTKDREKLVSTLNSAREKRKAKMRKVYLEEIAREVKRKQKAEARYKKLAEARLKRLKNSNNCTLCFDALKDLIKYTVLTLYGAVKGLVKAIIHPKRAYYKLRYPKETLSLNQLRPTELIALKSRMKRRFEYSDLSRNPKIAAMLTSIDGRKRKSKKKKKQRRKKSPRTDLIAKTNDFNCSPYISSLRKRPFLCVYFRCPWCYPQLISLLSIAKNMLELLLMCLAILVWSPCLLTLELVRGLMCCTMCTA